MYGVDMLPFAPVLWFLVVLAAGGRMLVARRTPADAPTWPAIAVGAAFGGVAAITGASPAVQVAVALGIGAVLWLLFWRWRRLMDDDRLPPGVGGNRLVDMVGEVTSAIDATDPGLAGAGDASPPVGHVTVGGEHWRATSTDGRALPVGVTVRVHVVRGTMLVVEPVDDGPAGATPGDGTTDAHAPRPTEPPPITTSTNGAS